MERVRGIVVAIIALFAIVSVSFAQSYSITPDDTVKMAGAMEDMETLSIQQVNTSNSIITLKWQKISASFPDKWEAAVCDNSLCNTSLVDSGMMNPVIPGDYGLLLLHITPHRNYGTAKVRYAVWNVATPSLRDTLTYILTVDETSGISESQSNKTFSIYPNPAKDNISIGTSLQTDFQYFVTDVSGRVLQAGISKTDVTLVPTGNLLNGIYNISISDMNKVVSTQKIAVQH